MNFGAALSPRVAYAKKFAATIAVGKKGKITHQNPLRATQTPSFNMFAAFGLGDESAFLQNRRRATYTRTYVLVCNNIRYSGVFL